jgi:hypothetical protein
MGCALIQNPSQKKGTTASQVIQIPGRFQPQDESKTTKENKNIPVKFNFINQRRKGLFNINEVRVSEEFSRNSSINLIKYSETLESDGSSKEQ